MVCKWQAAQGTGPHTVKHEASNLDKILGEIFIKLMDYTKLGLVNKTEITMVIQKDIFS